MGAANPGRNMWVALGIQNGKAGAIGSGATVFTYCQPTEISGFLAAYNMIESNRRLGTRFKGKSYLGTKEVPWGFTVELNGGNAGRLLAAMCGDEDISVLVTDEVAEHTFGFAETLPYVTVLCWAAGVANSTDADKTLAVLNAKINRATIAGGVDNVITLALEGVGTAVSAITTPVTSFTSDAPFFFNSDEAVGTIEIGATLGSSEAFEEATEFNLEIANGIAADHRIHGSSAPFAVREGDSAITGTINAIYNGETFAEIEEFEDGSDRAFVVQSVMPTAFYTGHYKTITINIEKARYTGDEPSWDPDIMSVSLPFAAEQTTSSPVTIVLKDSKVVEYTYSI